MRWVWIAVRIVLAMALGFLGPHPSIHCWYTPLSPGLFQIVRVEILGEQRPVYMDSAYVWAFVESYLFSCIAAFLLLSLFAWVWRRLARGEA